jgi:ABC-2 type transport system permease protein
VSAAVNYTRYELLRTFRNTRFFLFSLVFPLVLFFLVAGENRHAHLDGIAFPLYYMTGMVAWGTMSAVVAGGARIAMEREVGWNRQLRITPLSTRVYFAAKVLTGYAMAFVSIVLLYAAGLSLGVRLAPGDWLVMTAMIVVGLVPIAVLGVLLGHVLNADSIGPAMGGLVALLAVLGGAWGPLARSGGLHQLTTWLPSYWLVQASMYARAGQLWPGRAWVVIALWTLVLGRYAVRAWQRDTGRA